MKIRVKFSKAFSDQKKSNIELINHVTITDKNGFLNSIFLSKSFLLSYPTILKFWDSPLYFVLKKLIIDKPESELQVPIE